MRRCICRLLPLPGRNCLTALILGLTLACPTPQISLSAEPAAARTDGAAAASIQSWLEKADLSKPESLSDVPQLQLSREEAAQVGKQLWSAWQKSRREAATAAITEKKLTAGETELKWLERRFGEKPEGGMPLFISMHGGGGAPAQVNDQQWRNQIRLYEPEVGIVVAPRAPGNTWDLWHQSHIDTVFEALIDHYAVAEEIDLNRVYLMGYSAGGDGVYQLAPRMADRYAAASMMAGHPNESQPLGLRNLPFAIFMGGNDGAYNRNKVAEEWSKKLDDLQAADPQGYVHMTKIYPGKGHWMDREDREALPWMLEYRRQTLPKVVVWRQDDVVRPLFYWLEVVDAAQAKAGDEVRVRVEGNHITIDSDVAYSLRLHLSDDLVDLDQPVKVEWNKQIVHDAKVSRTFADAASAFALTHDPHRAWPAAIVISPKK